jgi:carbamoyl-phosphate synthase small subunit
VAKEILENNKPLYWNLFRHQVIGLANGISTYKMFKAEE